MLCRRATHSQTCLRFVVGGDLSPWYAGGPPPQQASATEGGDKSRAVQGRLRLPSPSGSRTHAKSRFSLTLRLRARRRRDARATLENLVTLAQLQHKVPIIMAYTPRQRPTSSARIRGTNFRPHGRHHGRPATALFERFQIFCVAELIELLLGDEAQGGGVHAVAFAGRSRTVVEDVAEV